MPCERPRRIKNPRYRDMMAIDVRERSECLFGRSSPPDLYLDVPCGTCHSCQRRRMNGYRLRLLYELSTHPNSIFLTLTFNNKALERFRGDYNYAVRLFLDRCRKRFGKQLRHWFTAEFGKLHGRAHYHGLLFDVPDGCAEELADLWSYGFIFIGYANEKTAHYITKYITKDLDGSTYHPRILTSRGIGLSYLNPDNVQFHKDVEHGVYRPYLVVNGKPIALPRYYTDKLYDDDDKLQLLLARIDKPFEKRIGDKVYHDELEYTRALRVLYFDQLDRGLTQLDYRLSQDLQGNWYSPRPKKKLKLSKTYSDEL